MKKELIRTERYILVVDESEIKQGDLFLTDDKRIEQSAPDWNPREWHKKIIAHLPLNNAPIIEGVLLLPPFSRHQEDGIEELVKEHFELNKELNNPSSFKAGYNKAKEKLDEVLKWIDEEILLNPYYKDSPRLKEGASMVKVKIQSLSQPKTPTHFEFEMKCGRCYSTEPDNDCWSAKECSRGYDFDDIILTTTNAQGQEIACGKYIYE